MTDGDATPERPVRLLFTCTANRVRSPFAAAVGASHARRMGLHVDVRSAGQLEAGRSAVDDMVEVARRHGYDLTTHVSATVSPELLDAADLVVPMTGQHVVDLVGMNLDALGRVLTLKEWAAATTAGSPLLDWRPDAVRDWAAGVTARPLEELLSGHMDVADPIGKPVKFYRRAAEEIESLVGTCFSTGRPDWTTRPD
jgi:protein-tyrosine phosphatase